jgi:diguanylate cyclase (GGDEF)-like protein
MSTAQSSADRRLASRSTRPALLILVVAAFLAAFAIEIGGMTMLGKISWPAILCLAILTAAAERFDWSVYGNSRVSVAFAPILASAALFGVVGIAVVVPVAIAAGSIGSGRPLLKTAFNFGVLTLAGSLSAFVFDLFGSVRDPGAWPEVVAPTLLASALNYAASTGLVAAAISLENRVSLTATWKEHFAWLAPHYLVLGLLGVSIAGAYVAFGLSGFALFLLPPLMMRLSLKQYVDRTAESMEQLRVVNDELQSRNQQLLDARAQAATDSLTGLRNHRAFQERIRSELMRTQGDSSIIGLIMLDVDGFKELNDSLGHLAGDQILRDLATALTDVVDRRDVYRYGGDEFAVLLPGLDAIRAAEVGEHLRSAVEKRTDINGGTISVGVASFPDMASTAEELIYTADMAMYWAKSAGKNRVGHLNGLGQQGADVASAWHIADRPHKPSEAVSALVSALGAKGATSDSHAERCSWYALQLADAMGLGEEERSIVGVAALLHDVGNVAVPESIFSKSGPLSKKERAQIRRHSTAALRILGHIPSVAAAAPAILHHHEHFDGSGYPDGLSGDEIPIASRILLVTDAFDAMTTDRSYRKALSVDEAIKELERNRGGQFDPAIVDAFLEVLRRNTPSRSGRKAAAAQLA